MKQSLSPASFQCLLIRAGVLAIGLSVAACSSGIPSTRQTELRVVSKVPRAQAVNINTASSEELERLPGIGKIVAQRIIEHREQYGPFRRPEHLMMVRGISDRKFREMQPFLVVE